MIVELAETACKQLDELDALEIEPDIEIANWAVT